MCDYQTEIVVIYNCHLQCNDNLILMLCIVCHWYHLFCCPPPLFTPCRIFLVDSVCVCVYILSPFLEMELVYLIKLVKFMAMWHFIF